MNRDIINSCNEFDFIDNLLEENLDIDGAERRDLDLQRHMAHLNAIMLRIGMNDNCWAQLKEETRSDLNWRNNLRLHYHRTKQAILGDINIRRIEMLRGEELPRHFQEAELGNFILEDIDGDRVKFYTFMPFYLNGSRGGKTLRSALIFQAISTIVPDLVEFSYNTESCLDHDGNVYYRSHFNISFNLRDMDLIKDAVSLVLNNAELRIWLMVGRKLRILRIMCVM